MTKLYLFPDPLLAAGLSAALGRAAGVIQAINLVALFVIVGRWLIQAIEAAVSAHSERKERNAKDTRRDGVIARKNNQ
jgi:hypothetical protein